MIPASFKYANRLLGAPKGHVPEESEIGEILALPVWTDGQQSISLWRPTLRERLSFLFFGKMWVIVWFGGTQPPIALTACRTYLGEVPPADKWLKRFKRGLHWSDLLATIKRGKDSAMGRIALWWWSMVQWL